MHNDTTVEALELRAAALGEDQLFLDYYDHRLDYEVYIQSRLREEPTTALAAAK